MLSAGGIVSDLPGAGGLKGSLVLIPKKVLDFNDFHSTAMDGGTDTQLFGGGVTCQLISSTLRGRTAGNTSRGEVGAEANLKPCLLKKSLLGAPTGEEKFEVTFNWSMELGVPGAIIVKNNSDTEFYLKTITLEDLPGHGAVVFVANSWVYPHAKYSYDRIFFTNNTYLPHHMPAALKP
ncbi:hypothetical protein VPH35_068555 [Triticum aestivum]